MPVTVPAGFFQAAYKLSGPGQSGELNIVIGHETVLAPQVAARTALDAFQDFFVEQILAVPISLVGMQARFGPQPGGLVVDLAPDPLKPTAGLNGSNILPLNNAILIKKSTGQGGRTNQGRIYVPGIDEDAVNNDGTITLAGINQINAAADAWLLELDAQGVQMMILHSDPLEPPDLVTQLICQPKMATQRTRLRD